ncbi:uncharacterized protein CCR75_000123 [Bremia lactucae]|uniref:Uncharacterized protein n=1 Tax=Bremia lactucae TaxID=4779 RepID=A0A976NYJ2_BRELC|nr:hypothetical protein CCR75_000123 [Bremia lactucae]
MDSTLTPRQGSAPRANGARAHGRPKPARLDTRPPPSVRTVPDDSKFKASFQRILDPAATTDDQRYAALSALPTTVDPAQCTQMWIPAPQLAAAHNLSDVLRSLDSTDQPQLWKDERVHLRSFYVSPNRGISFECTSDTALSRLGGLQLTICGITVTIRKYSSYDKLYYVDLRRLPAGVTDPEIYDWFTNLGAQPILISATYACGSLTSRDRTVYFNSVRCPDALFLDKNEPLREIFLVPDDKPCFVHHRERKYNRVKPPSLRSLQRLNSPVSDESMESSNGAAGDQGTSTTRGAKRNSKPRVTIDLSSPPVDTLLPSTPSSRASTLTDAPSGASVTTPKVTFNKRMIVDALPEHATEWQRVQHSQYGIINRGGAKFIEPQGLVPCELYDELSDPHALVYSFPVTPNCYDVLREEGYDSSLPPNVDLDAGEQEDDEDGMTNPVSGFTASSPLLTHETEVTALKTVRTLSLRVEQISIVELQRAIDEFLEQDVLKYTSHEDVLAAIQAQPAYFRRVFHLPLATQNKLVMAQAVYRTICAEPLHEDELTDFHVRLRSRYNNDSIDAAEYFTAMFPSDELQQAALHSAISDLFLMVFAPGIYVDPIKVQALLGPLLPPKRIRYTPFLLWSDLILLCMARTDAILIYLKDVRTPKHVVTALTHLATTPMPANIAARPSRLVNPYL